MSTPLVLSIPLQQALARLRRECPGFVSGEAAYDPLGQFILLSEVDAAELAAAAQGDPRSRSLWSSTFIHEYTHWLDHVASLSGAQLLSQSVSALRAFASGNEQQFFQLTRQVNVLRRLKYADYYREIYAPEPRPAAGVQRLKYEYSLGQALDLHGRPNPDDPILFTRFETTDGQPIARMPFSEVSLWEVRAVAAENISRVAEILGVTNEEEKRHRKDFFHQERFRLLYQPSTLEYSVAAHCFSNAVRNPDILLGYRDAAELAGAVLNLADEDLRRLRPHDPGSPFVPFHDAFLRKRDRGYVFWDLCHHARGVWKAGSTTWLDETFARAGLDSVAACRQRAISEMARLSGASFLGKPSTDAESIILARYRELLMYGTGAMQTFRLDRVEEHAAAGLSAQKTGFMPTCLLGDYTTVGNAARWENATFHEQFGEWFDLIAQFRRWFDGFQAACLPAPDRFE